MSVRIMTQVWPLALPPHLKLMLLALADNANDEGYCYPSQETLAEKCTVDPRTVRRQISALQSQGLLEITQRGKKRTNLYRVVIGHQCPVTSQSDRTPMSSSDRTPVSGPYEPSLEPSVNTAPNGAKPLTEHQAMKKAIVEAVGWDPKQITSWGPIDKASKQLRDIGVQPDEVAGRAKVFREKRSWQTLTPQTLTAAWPDLVPPTVRPCPNRCGPDGFYHPNDHPYPVACPNPGCETKRKVKQ